MAPLAQPAKPSLPRIILVGLVVPVLLALLDRWLLAREFKFVFISRREVAASQAMILFVLQVGLLGVLCGRLIHSPWLRWIIFGWCLLFTDLNAASSLVPEASQALFTAQIGLVTVWAVLGTSSWKIRTPVVLLLIPLLWAQITQTAALCLICFILRSQRFRLASITEETLAGNPPNASSPAPRPIQFGVRDVLLWTTALAPLLAVSRLGQGRMLTDGILHAIVLVVALWAALGQGAAWLRWPLLALFAFAAGLILAQVDWYGLRWFPIAPPFWSNEHLQYICDWQWDTIAAFFLAGGMLAATLLIYRVLGYRLCRQARVP